MKHVASLDRARERRAEVADEIATLEAAIGERRQFLAGFDAAIEAMQGPPERRRGRDAVLALPAPAPKKRRARGRGAPRAKDAATPHAEKLKELWPSSKSTPAIAAELRVTTSYCYQLAKRLKLGKRPKASRAPRPARAKKAPARKATAEPAPAAAAPQPPRMPPPAARAAPAPASGRSAPAPRTVPAARLAAEDAAIAEHIASKGVSRSADLGPHQAIVDAARSVSWDVMKLKVGFGQPAQWSLNGAGIRTPELYRRVNAELARRGRPPIAMPQEEPAQ